MQMQIDQVPIKSLTEIPRLRSPERGTAVGFAIVARLGRAIAGCMQSLLAALHESRLEKARREIDSLSHLIPAAGELTGLRARHPRGDQPTREPTRRRAEARWEPSQVA